jgi:hypothetical protein
MAPPGNERRPGVGSEAPSEQTGQVDTIVAHGADFLAYIARINREFGWDACMAAMFGAGRDTASHAAEHVWVHPRWVEIERRRVVDHEPCRLLSCQGRCSRCIHADAWRKRGGEPYAGAGAA